MFSCIFSQFLVFKIQDLDWIRIRAHLKRWIRTRIRILSLQPQQRILPERQAKYYQSENYPLLQTGTLTT
jgi:hypothetical protein